MVEVVDADGAAFAELGLDAVPRRVLEVEGDSRLRIEGAEDQLDHPLVARADQLHANRPEPPAETPDALRELGHHVRPVARKLRREREAVRRLRGPLAELLVAGQSVPGRVQLHGRERLRVHAEELLRVGARGIEAGLPRRVGPAGCADLGPG